MELRNRGLFMFKTKQSLLFIILSIVFSILAIALLGFGLLKFQEDSETYLLSDFLVSGILCLLLSLFFAYQHKRRLQFRFIPRYLSVTLIKCSNYNCNFKEEREFKRGDYIFKEVGTCPKCNNTLLIESIYAKPLKK